VKKAHIIDTKDFRAHVYGDHIDVLPPVRWTAELADLLDRGVINLAGAEQVMDEWLRDMRPKVLRTLQICVQRASK
jgi:hypothetical protein